MTDWQPQSGPDHDFVSQYGLPAFQEFTELTYKYNKIRRAGGAMQMFPVEMRRLYKKHGIPVGNYWDGIDEQGVYHEPS